jgi:Holliday junction resolvase RusA-like endonuclease
MRKTDEGAAYGLIVRSLANNRIAGPLLEGPLGIRVQFYARSRAMDMDNYVGKALWDALQGVLYVNDKQICESHNYKLYDRKNPRLIVDVWTLEQGVIVKPF